MIYEGRMLLVVSGVMTPETVLDGTNTTLYTPPLDMRHSVGASIQYAYSAGAANTVTETVWGSNKKEPGQTTDADWEDITALLLQNADVTGASGVVSQLLDATTGAGLYRFVRGKLLRTAGTVTIDTVSAVTKEMRD